MDWYKWVFDGIGVAIINFFGGLFGNKISKKKNIKQRQSSGDSSEQIQVGYFEKNSNDNIFINQKQKSKNNSFQSQIGGFNA